MDQTERIDWDSFRYIERFDAYYNVHSDTNYRSVTFSYGERVGDYIQLYWKDFYYGGFGTECVTLLDRGDGQYWFASHLLSDKDIPSPYDRPEGDPMDDPFPGRPDPIRAPENVPDPPYPGL